MRTSEKTKNWEEVDVLPICIRDHRKLRYLLPTRIHRRRSIYIYRNLHDTASSSPIRSTQLHKILYHKVAVSKRRAIKALCHFLKRASLKCLWSSHATVSNPFVIHLRSHISWCTNVPHLRRLGDFAHLTDPTLVTYVLGLGNDGLVGLRCCSKYHIIHLKHTDPIPTSNFAGQG